LRRSHEHFGEPDAQDADTDSLDRDHIARAVEAHLKCREATHGQEVVVGVKGSGKTDLRLHVEASDPDALVVNFSASDIMLNIDASELPGSSGRGKNVVSAILLTEFAQRAGRQGKSPTMLKLKGAADRITQMIKNVPEATQVDVYGIVKFSPAKLMQTSAKNVVQNATNDLLKDVIDALKDQRGYILIDDIEDVIDNIEEHPLVLESIVRAAHDINHVSKDRLHVLVFLKHGLWRAWYEEQREYDKVAHRIAFLEWDRKSLVDLIGRRIATARGITDTLTAEELWRKEFEWEGTFESFTYQTTRYSVNGPRDVIALCNAAGVAAGDLDSPIKLTHIEGQLAKYSEQKLLGIHQDFGVLYPGLAVFVQRVFRNSDATLSAQKLASQIEDKVKTDPDAKFEDYSSAEWYRNATSERLAMLMYEIGVVGIGVEPDVRYAIGSRTVSRTEFMSQKQLLVHPAFRRNLGIQNA
jgi:hypothetical protein